MMHRHQRERRFRAQGFTLIEVISIIVVLSIAMTAVIALNAGIFSGQATNTSMQTGAALMQECAEQVMAVRKKAGYSAVVAGTNFGVNKCGTISAFTDSTVTPSVTYPIPSVAITEAYVGSGCPGTCKLVSITQGSITRPINLMLVSY